MGFHVAYPFFPPFPTKLELSDMKMGLLPAWRGAIQLLCKRGLGMNGLYIYHPVFLEALSTLTIYVTSFLIQAFYAVSPLRHIHCAIDVLCDM